MREVYRIIGSIILLSFATFAWGEETEVASKSWDDYKIITERNIFSRNRTKAEKSPVVRRQAAVVLPEQSYYTLRGITRQPDGFISFIEDSRTGEITKLRTGQLIGDGKIKGMTLDYISYELEGESTRVEIGMNFKGQVSSSGTQYSSSWFDDSQGSSSFSEMGQSPDMDQSQPASENKVTAQPVPETQQQDENMDNILQRLKERRKKELEE